MKAFFFKSLTLCITYSKVEARRSKHCWTFKWMQVCIHQKSDFHFIALFQLTVVKQTKCQTSCLSSTMDKFNSISVDVQLLPTVFSVVFISASARRLCVCVIKDSLLFDNEVTLWLARPVGVGFSRARHPARGFSDCVNKALCWPTFSLEETTDMADSLIRTAVL